MIKKKKNSDLFKTFLTNSNELGHDAKLSKICSLLDSSQNLVKEQIMVANEGFEKLPINEKSQPTYLETPKLELKQLPIGLTYESLEPCDTFTIDIPSKLIVEGEGEIIKSFKSHKTKMKAFHDRIFSRKFLNISYKVNLYASRMICAR